MKRDTISNFFRPAAVLRRGAATLCLGLAALALAGGARAQVKGPLTSSPLVPTPYQSPLFHSGGTPGPLPLAAPFVDLPLFAQLQGTPTGVYPNTALGVATEIPSFVLGNYNPTRPPGATGASNYFPNHFGDGSEYQITGPFNYVPAGVNIVTVDDDSTTNFTAPTGFANVTITGTAAQTDPIAATANNRNYHRLPPGTNGTATWTLTAVNGGSYSLYFHIPDNIAGTDGNAELRSTQVVYAIQLGPTATAPIIQATASQTEANSTQYLAGPFQLAPGETVTVTLTRDSTQGNATLSTLNQGNNVDYLIADSMTIQPTIGDVQSAPTAINTDSYPTDLLGVKYWGIYVPDGTTTGQGQAVSSGTIQNILNNNAPADTNPHPTAPGFAPQNPSTPVFRYADPTKTQEDNGAADTNPLNAGYHKRLIKQLVYFGRSDPSFVFTTTTDDNSAGFTATTTEADGLGTYTFHPILGGGATNGEYQRARAVNMADPSVGTKTSTATWTLIAPNSAFYFLYVHLPANAANEARITDAIYTVTVGGVSNTYTINQNSSPADSTVLLPTGPLNLTAGQTVTVSLNNLTAAAPTATTYVVADSVTLTTGNGTGAIYCMDGFTGGIVWRFQTPGTANGPSAPVFSSPVVTKIHVLITPSTATAAAVYADKLVVIVGDNNGQIYCLDAAGNGDGTSNENAIDPASGRPIYFPQPGYGATPPVQVDATGYTPHVGTTSVYWVYRPDARQPRDQAVAGGPVKTLITTNKPDPNSDLPVPAAFGSASPTVFVDPLVTTLAKSNATVYVGNTNGVLYALDALGVDPGLTASHATSTPSATDYGDTFNVALDLRQTPTEAVTPTPDPLWWFTLRGPSPNSGANPSGADIESAPALYTHYVPAAGTTAAFYYPTVYVGSAHEQEGTSNVGRLYALNGVSGPSGNGGKTLTPGALNYNVSQRPQTSTTDTADWSFPDALGTDAYGAGKSSNKKPRPALGNLTGSPVVFTNINDTGTNADGTSRLTRIYFAANVGLEVPATPSGGTASTVAEPRPDDTQTGRVWAVNLDGSVGTATKASVGVWAFPVANDPNDATLDSTPEPFAPLGAFLHMTPAIGYVQFPANILNGDGTTSFTHTDVTNTGANGVRGQVVPMLYVGTRGVNDTALYAVDVDGANDAGRLIYRVPSPSAAIFQSSPLLLTNATGDPFNLTLPRGNGGSVLVAAGGTLYDFGATPISNPGLVIPGTTTPQPYPLIRENAALTGFGPISSPAAAASDTTDLLGAAGTTSLPTYYGSRTVTDWVYCGDSSTGLCRGITPYDITDGGIPVGIGGEVPPAANPVSAVDLSATIQTYLAAKGQEAGTRGVPTNNTPVGDMAPLGPAAPLPVYEWGENVYIRFTNVVPPTAGLYVLDSSAGTPSATNAVTAYGLGGPIQFDLSDSDPQNPRSDHATVPPIVVTALPSDGFVINTATTGNLVDGNGNRWMGAYTYALSDGTGRRNTPGARRSVINATQIVHKYTTTDGINFTDVGTVTLSASVTNGNVTSVPIYNGTGQITGYQNTFAKVQPVDQPRFGILNPLALRAGGVPLPLAGATTNATQSVGDEAGPFRGVDSPPVQTYSYDSTSQTYTPGTVVGADTFSLQALTDGNTVFTKSAPPSTSLGGNPVQFPRGTNDPSGISLPMHALTVVTATGQLNPNSSGDNADTTGAGFTAPPTGMFTGSNYASDGLITTNFGAAGQAYAMNLADRSALALAGSLKTLRVKMNVQGDTGRGGIAWNDNTTPVNQTSGHDAVVNFLPWETAPTGRAIGLNNSADYPDIASGNISASLYANDGANGVSGSLDTSTVVATPPTDSGTTPQKRTVYASVVQVHVSVPQYQPANQQLYKQYSGNSGIAYNPAYQIAPNTPTTQNGIASTADTVFPMGYVATRRVYVPNANGRYEPGCAYRDFQVFTGVAPSMSLSMADGTLSVPAPLPAGFGVQTDKYTGLGSFNPYSTSATIPSTFQQFYLPVTVHNDGNVNLLNVHLDQKVVLPGTLTTQRSLLLGSDPTDPLSVISAYDVNGVTGPTLGNLPGTTVAEMPFLVRSSLDDDTIQAYGRHPSSYSILDANNYHLYPGATFHKPHVGDGGPTMLTVPDAPDPNRSVQYFSLNGSPVPGGLPTTALDPNNLDANGKPLPYKARPYIGLAVPFGTPVGSYYQKIRAFEALDPAGYSAVFNGGSYSSLAPPQYGGAVGGITGVAGTLGDTYLVGSPSAADPGVTLQANVVEARMTDGMTAGALPQIDAGPAGGTATSPLSTPNFQPAAFRDPVNGGLSVYLTTGRNGTPAIPYTIQGYSVPHSGSAFLPSDNTKAWWGTSDVSALPTAGLNSGLSIAQDQPVYSGSAFSYDTSTAYAFSVNTNGGANTLFCYPVPYSTTAPGTLGTAQQVSTDTTQTKYGVRGLYCAQAGFTDNLWAFWTGSTRGRTALYYNARAAGTGAWTNTPALLPVPAGLTAVSDAAPTLMYAPVTGANGATLKATIEVTYSGLAPDGTANLYESRYLPNGATLGLTSYPSVTEKLAPVGGWFQARDVAWSRAGILDILVADATHPNGASVLYSSGTPSTPLFKSAVFDKASGLLVYTGVTVSGVTGTSLVSVDLATGRVHFTGTPSGTVTATFTPQARRITTNSRADTSPITFLDPAYKVPGISTSTIGTSRVPADRRWYIWRRAGVSGDAHSATLYYKTRRLTAFLPFLPSPITGSLAITVNGAAYNGPYDLEDNPPTSSANGSVSPGSARLYFPISDNGMTTGNPLEGASVKVTYTYTDSGGATVTVGPTPVDTIQWQDERQANDFSVNPTDAVSGLADDLFYAVPINQIVNENNVAAFLDTDAFKNVASGPAAPDPSSGVANLTDYAHKVWLFWNSTRNGTADLYYETINPKF